MIVRTVKAARKEIDMQIEDSDEVVQICRRTPSCGFVGAEESRSSVSSLLGSGPIMETYLGLNSP
jgi:hypothetical protein